MTNKKDLAKGLSCINTDKRTLPKEKKVCNHDPRKLISVGVEFPVEYCPSCHTNVYWYKDAYYVLKAREDWLEGGEII